MHALDYGERLASLPVTDATRAVVITRQLRVHGVRARRSGNPESVVMPSHNRNDHTSLDQLTGGAAARFCARCVGTLHVSNGTAVRLETLREGKYYSLCNTNELAACWLFLSSTLVTLGITTVRHAVPTIHGKGAKKCSSERSQACLLYRSGAARTRDVTPHLYKTLS